MMVIDAFVFNHDNKAHQISINAGRTHSHGGEDPVAAAHLAHLDDFASTALRPSAMS
jgi:hypothetical protein